MYLRAPSCILEKNPNKTIEEVLKIVEKKPYEYQYALPEHKENINIAITALKKNSDIYNFIPEKLRNNNYYINKLAVQKDGINLKYIPFKFINKEIINLAIFNKTRSICYDPADGCNIFKYIPEKFMTNKIITDIININPLRINDIPTKFITEELLLIAKKSFLKKPLKYSNIPEYFKDDIDIILKIANSGFCDSIKEKLKSKDISILILSVNPSLIKYVPNEFFDDFDYKMRLVVCNYHIVKFNNEPILNMLWNIEWNFDIYEKNYVEIIQNIKYLIYSTNFYKLLKILLNDIDYKKIIIDHLHLFVELINNDEKLLLLFNDNNILFFELKMLIPENENTINEYECEYQKKYIQEKFPNKYIYFIL